MRKNPRIKRCGGDMIWNLVTWLFGSFCFHKWKVVMQGKLIEKSKMVGYYYNLQCTKCGDIKRINQQ